MDGRTEGVVRGKGLKEIEDYKDHSQREVSGRSDVGRGKWEYIPLVLCFLQRSKQIKRFDAKEIARHIDRYKIESLMNIEKALLIPTI